MRQWLAISAFVLAAGVMSGSASASCAVQQDLSNFHRSTKGFISYLQSGNGAHKVQQLQSWMRSHPPAPLQQRMRAVGIQSVAPDMVKLMKQNSALLQILSQQGRAAALEAAQQMGMPQLSHEVGVQVEALPCDQIKEESYGSKLVAIAAADARQQQQMINAAIAWVSFLVLGGSGLYFLDRIGIRRIRRTKRYPCAVPCTLQAGRLSVSGQLVDLSRAGAKLRLDAPCEAPGRVTLAFGGRTVMAHVRWQTTDYIGVKFSKEFNFLQLHRLLEAFPMEDDDDGRKKRAEPLPKLGT